MSRHSSPATPNSEAPAAGRPKDPEKRAAILAAAKQLFPGQGFEGVSVEAIAATAGVSKLTVYSHFQDKETLFMQAIQALCQELLPDRLFLPAADEPIEQALQALAERFFALVASPAAISLQRLVLADVRGDARLGQIFWQAGPARILASFEGFLQRAAAAGELDIADAAQAAMHLLSLLKGAVNLRMLRCGAAAADIPASQARAHVAGVVEVFLRAYRPGIRTGGVKASTGTVRCRHR